MISPKWLIGASFARVGALIGSILLFVLGVNVSGPSGALMIIAALVLFFATLTFSFWVQIRLLAQSKLRITEPEVLRQFTSRRSCQIIFQRVVFGVFLVAALVIFIFLRGLPQLVAFVVSVEVLISIALLEYGSKKYLLDQAT